MSIFKKQKGKPFENMPINDKGSDLYNLKVSDIARVRLNRSYSSSFPFNHLVYSGHRLGKDFFLANFQDRITEFVVRRKDLKDQTNFLDYFFIIIDNNKAKIKEFYRKENSKGFQKRFNLIKLAYS